MWPAAESPVAVTFSCDDLQGSADGAADVVAPLPALVVDAPDVVDDDDSVGDAAEGLEPFESLHPDNVEATTMRPSSAIRRVLMSRAPFKRSSWVLPRQRLHRQFRALFQGCHAQVSSHGSPGLLGSRGSLATENPIEGMPLRLLSRRHAHSRLVALIGVVAILATVLPACHGKKKAETASDAVAAYLIAWGQRDYAVMGRLQNHPPDAAALEDFNRAMVTDVRVKSAKFTAAAPVEDKEKTHATVALTNRFEVDQFGAWTTHGTLRLTHRDDHWYVDWSPQEVESTLRTGRSSRGPSPGRAAPRSSAPAARRSRARRRW